MVPYNICLSLFIKCKNNHLYEINDYCLKLFINNFSSSCPKYFVILQRFINPGVLGNPL